MTCGASRLPQRAPAVDRELERLGLPESGKELLEMLGFLTAPGGPMQQVATTGRLSSRDKDALDRMHRQAEVIANFLRARISFFVTGSPQGQTSFDTELTLAGANLDVSRALVPVVEKLLARRVPTADEFDLLAERAMKIYAALEAFWARLLMSRPVLPVVSRREWRYHHHVMNGMRNGFRSETASASGHPAVTA